MPVLFTHKTNKSHHFFPFSIYICVVCIRQAKQTFVLENETMSVLCSLSFLFYFDASFMLFLHILHIYTTAIRHCTWRSQAKWNTQVECVRRQPHKIAGRNVCLFKNKMNLCSAFCNMRRDDASARFYLL